MAILDKLREADQESDTQGPFDEFEQEAMISLAIDMPDYFMSVANYLKPEYFDNVESRYVMQHILGYFDEHAIIPTRRGLRNLALKELTVDSQSVDRIRELIDKPCNPRDLPIIKNTLHKWARKRAFGMLYTKDAMDAFTRGQYDQLEEIINSANRINDIGSKGFWLSEQIDELFQPDAIVRMPTGFQQLDKLINWLPNPNGVGGIGGPSPGEVLCWLAGTNVGKSVMLSNNSVDQWKLGKNVLHITLEMSGMKTAMRCVGALTSVNMKDFSNHEDMIKQAIIKQSATSGSSLCFWELPPDECSVDHIYSVLTNLKRTKGWKPDVIVIDYLELLVGRRKSDNDGGDYSRQKHVSNQIRGLAKNEDVIIYTATQTNRSGASGAEDKLTDLNQMAESFGKSMPMDYVISLNQTQDEHNASPPRIRMFVAKNRNGPKHNIIECTINYNNMQVRAINGNGLAIM